MESWIWIPYFKGCSPLRNIVAESPTVSWHCKSIWTISCIGKKKYLCPFSNASMHQQKNHFTAYLRQWPKMAGLATYAPLLNFRGESVADG